MVGLGYDTVEVEYEAWVGKAPVLHVGIECADVDASVHIAHEVVGDLDASIARMAELPPVRNDWPAHSASQHRELFQNALRPATANFAPHQAIDVVRKVLPKEGVLAVDVGAHTHQIGSQWTAHAPRTFLVTNGWSSMGFGIPAALAAKLAHPELPVVCILGDGGFQMTCGEVAVARRQGLAIPFVVLDDHWLSLIKVKQERQGLPYYGTEVSPDDCLDAARALLRRAYGWGGQCRRARARITQGTLCRQPDDHRNCCRCRALFADSVRLNWGRMGAAKQLCFRLFYCLFPVSSVSQYELFTMKAADHEGCDVIILGTHGKGFLRQTFLGRVSVSVLERTRKPVYVIPLPSKKTNIDWDNL